MQILFKKKHELTMLGIVLRSWNDNLGGNSENLYAKNFRL